LNGKGVLQGKRSFYKNLGEELMLLLRGAPARKRGVFIPQGVCESATKGVLPVRKGGNPEKKKVGLQL